MIGKGNRDVPKPFLVVNRPYLFLYILKVSVGKPTYNKKAALGATTPPDTYFTLPYTSVAHAVLLA